MKSPPKLPVPSPVPLKTIVPPLVAVRGEATVALRILLTSTPPPLSALIAPPAPHWNPLSDRAPVLLPKIVIWPASVAVREFPLAKVYWSNRARPITLFRPLAVSAAPLPRLKVPLPPQPLTATVPALLARMPPVMMALRFCATCRVVPEPSACSWPPKFAVPGPVPIKDTELPEVAATVASMFILVNEPMVTMVLLDAMKGSDRCIVSELPPAAKSPVP